MTSSPDFGLCSVPAKSCTHHAHCARAQFRPHPTRQRYITANRRGDECQYFYAFAPFVQIADGDSIADTLAESENQGQLRQPTRSEVAAVRETVGGSDSVDITPAGSDAGQDDRTNAEAGGVQFHGAARSARAVGQQPQGTATNATPSPAPFLSGAVGRAGHVRSGVTAGAGLSSAPASSRLTDCERSQLAAARRLRAA